MLTVLYKSELFSNIVIELTYKDSTWSHDIHQSYFRSEYDGYICNSCSLSHIAFKDISIDPCKICQFLYKKEVLFKEVILDESSHFAYLHKPNKSRLHLGSTTNFKSMNSMYIRLYIKTKLNG